MKRLAILTIYSLISLTCFSITWHVGPTQTYTLPSQIKPLVENGDTIYIDSGVYNNDAVKWNKSNLKIIGLGSAGNRTILRYTGNIPNGKGIFVFGAPGTCDNAYIENIVFDGAQVSDNDGGNGAGIRFQANNLTVKNCKFINCQNGILEGNSNVTTSNVTIENSEFENNGYQQPNNSSYSGYEHNIYIGASTDTLLVQNCYFHNPRGQANCLKTRAQRSYILYNLIDEADGNGSWEINIAQGGLNVIMGNIIIQGTSGTNHGIVGYDAATNVLEDFYFVNNTVINRFQGNARYFKITPTSGITTYKIYNNIFASVPGANNTMLNGNIPAVLDTMANVNAADFMTFGFTDPSGHDFSLTPEAIAAINTGVDAGSTSTGFSLLPLHMYQSFAVALLPRSTAGGVIDIGAFESSTATGILSVNGTNANWAVYPNPSNGTFSIACAGLPHGKIKIEVYDAMGKMLLNSQLLTEENIIRVQLPKVPKGIYFVRATEGSKKVMDKKIVVL